jgi:ABC-type branched-subunit amino acid transport system ATPase component
MRADAILSAADVEKRFRGNHVLRGVSVEVRRGMVSALIGSNGAGKSTLLNVISGFLKPDGGRIVLAGRDITRDPPYARARAGLARTFQHPRSFRSLTVLESVVLGATPAADEGLALNLLRTLRLGPSVPAHRVTWARDCLARCRIAHRADVAAADLTYGEQKLLMLAQVLALDGELLCFDELCAGLEPGLAEHVGTVFRGLVERGKTVLFIEHNLHLVRQLADWVVFLHQGRVHREGPTDLVLGDPEVVKLYLGE